jgi:hypothetical protein
MDTKHHAKKFLRLAKGQRNTGSRRESGTIKERLGKMTDTNSTYRGNRRKAQQNAVACILLNDPKATWGNLSTWLCSPIFPEPWLGSVDNTTVKRLLLDYIDQLARNVRAMPSGGQNEQIAKVMADFPRQSTAPKKKARK